MSVKKNEGRAVRKSTNGCAPVYGKDGGQAATIAALVAAGAI